MPHNTVTPDNIDRLLTHLKNGSLAERLAHAYRTATDPAEALTKVIEDRVSEAREEVASPQT